MRHYSFTTQNPPAPRIARHSPRSVQLPQGIYRTTGKRICDLGFALLLIPATVLVLAVVACLMLLKGDRGPMFFGHLRVGKDGKVFKCWKIRTMVVDAESKLRDYLASSPEAAAEWAQSHKLDKDPRITALGQFLRKSSLDELPQLWNILRGDMSLVGPRPVVRAELRKYGQYAGPYTQVRPGVTGLWQVSGRNEISYDDRVQMDMQYIRTLSLKNDLIVIAKTVMVMLARTGK